MKRGDIINNRYLLVKSIGRGSFGEVWLATDQKLGLDVAIKIYIALDSKGVNEFKKEFKNVYNLHHPNLLRADYFDSIGNNPYLVMSYCPSSSETKIGKMDEAEIWKFVNDVASGLQYLHDHDIVHRDIKPDNILLDMQDVYVITDFGLSTKMHSTFRKASGRGEDSNPSGTIGYMAPEMFSANPVSVKATDIWALGATIYELATGEMPFCGQGGVMELHGAAIPNLPAKYSKELNDLMRKCLAKEPWDRPTAKEILNWRKKPNPPKPSKWWIWVIAAIIVGFLTWLIIAPSNNPNPEPEPEPIAVDSVPVDSLVDTLATVTEVVDSVIISEPEGELNPVAPSPVTPVNPKKEETISKSEANQLLNEGLKEIASEFPMDLGIGAIITRAYISGDYVMYMAQCDENVVDMDIMKQNKAEVLNGIKQWLVASTDPAVNDFSKICVAAGKGIGYLYVGDETGKQLAVYISNNELKKLIKH